MCEGRGAVRGIVDPICACGCRNEEQQQQVRNVIQRERDSGMIRRDHSTRRERVSYRKRLLRAMEEGLEKRASGVNL